MNRSTLTKCAAAAGVAALLAAGTAAPSLAHGVRGHVAHRAHVGAAIGGAIAGAAVASAYNNVYDQPGYGYYGAAYPAYAYAPAYGYSSYAYAPAYSGYGYGAYAAVPAPVGAQPYSLAPPATPYLPPDQVVGQKTDGAPIYAGHLTSRCTIGLAAQDRC